MGTVTQTRINAAVLCSAVASNVEENFIFEAIGSSPDETALIYLALSAVPACKICLEHGHSVMSGCRLRWAEMEAKILNGEV